MAPLADALAAVGFRVAVPLLAGHGTEPDDLVGVTWDQWLDSIPTARVVIGQSLGGSLALALAARGGADGGVACINGLGYSDADAIDALSTELASGAEWIAASSPDIRAEGVTEVAYHRLPVSALLEMSRGVGTIDLPAVTVPVLVVTSTDDAVVDPHHSDVIATSVRGPVERIRLPRSGHVATLDLDAPVLIETTLEWVSRALSPRR